MYFSFLGKLVCSKLQGNKWCHLNICVMPDVDLDSFFPQKFSDIWTLYNKVFITQKDH